MNLELIKIRTTLAQNDFSRLICRTFWAVRLALELPEISRSWYKGSDGNRATKEQPVTIMTLLKILFFAHAWHLAKTA
jgi:hypothetical protein